ncbi:hypothetical protein HY640_05000 [Candidatus Woesearchaeota archaeon]|nr:hypothetical protein [Candidatus Woesearchaeota archaeon]
MAVWNPVVVWMLTLAVGPAAFFIISRFFSDSSPKYPVGEIDGVGDIIFLPLFNAAVFSYGVSDTLKVNSGKVFFAVAVSVLFTGGFLLWQKNRLTHNDWTRPVLGKLSFGGWYHGVFMLVQSFIVFTSLLIFYSNALIWVLLAGYMLAVLVRFNCVYFRLV